MTAWNNCWASGIANELIHSHIHKHIEAIVGYYLTWKIQGNINTNKLLQYAADKMCLSYGCCCFFYISFMYDWYERENWAIYFHLLRIKCAVAFIGICTLQIHILHLHLSNKVCLNFKNKHTYISPLWILCVSATLLSWSFDWILRYLTYTHKKI